MRKINVPFVRGNVRTFCHITKITQIALVDHFPVIFFLDTIHLPGLAFIDQIEQSRERGAKAYATPATVANVIHTVQLIEELVLVVEIGGVPVYGVPGRRLETTFT